MSREPRLLVQLVLDLVAVLVFAGFTLSMATGVLHLHSWGFRTLSAAFALAGTYFLARGVLNLRDTLRGRARFSS